MKALLFALAVIVWPAHAANVVEVCQYTEIEFPGPCFGPFELDTAYDWNRDHVPLDVQGGPGFIIAGYHDSTTGEFVEVFRAAYGQRIIQFFPDFRSLLEMGDQISFGEFEDPTVNVIDLPKGLGR